MVKAIAVVHLEKGEPIRAPQVPIEEVSVEQAMRENTPKQEAALCSKLTSLLEANTFNIIKGKLSLEIKVISSRLVLRNKMRPNRTVGQRKAKIVIRGFKQTYRIDYFKTFASVLRYNTLRLLLAKAVVKDLEIEQMDVQTAFLNLVYKEEVYIEVLDFFYLVIKGGFFT